MSMEEGRTRSNSTLRLRVNFKEVNLSTLISTNFEFECLFCQQLWLFGYPTLLALGLVGNVLCIMSFAAHKLRRETRFLCTLLAVFDSFTLVTAFATRWPDAAFGISLTNMHPAICHIITIANYSLPELAAWTLIGISIERVLSGMEFIICIKIVAPS